ncbi:MAG: tRNA uridine-5-carboxymethylaminomethyl(34) synthesis enzyme MnmG [Candidatus Krumholzibacteria bacterium]|jgi:tRNA uridine 5-carboxymethylaminomethyl modification enzyme|nr:tRNA uridine-5-carboxymethylaminomethyl(34) synthesis enzyme MnmG [Candidatus Krumholzibacteria bacterium]
MGDNGRSYDIIVIGAGHAGIEAALAASRLGCRTALVTHKRSEIGRMPCNPAIGGLGKGHLVRELDVLGGEMGLAIDATGIQFRILNRRKGPAVQAPRAQADKHRYQAYMAEQVLAQDALDLIEGDARTLLAEPGRGIYGIGLQTGREVRGERVILCSGTFLRGLMHVGERQSAGGREGAASSEGISDELRRLGIALRRLKTGTPPRLRADSIDYRVLEAQPTDADARPFSFRTRDFSPPSHRCWLAYTTERTHALIRENLARSPLYCGAISGRGTRYCPSIEDKVVRFAEKERHLVFLEPEGLTTPEIYVNGISTSLPADIQEAVVHSIRGLERAVLVRYGYAVEYDSVPSWQVLASLECKTVPGLYLAGQILGTSGYEEAAAQGLVAGINAVRSLDGREAWIPARHEAYIGVLIDDLATKEITEPYRMFTSRAEHRLQLRCDNAETRLTETAAAVGLLPAAQITLLRRRMQARRRMLDFLDRTQVPDPAGGGPCTVAGLLRRPQTAIAELNGSTSGGGELMTQLYAEARVTLDGNGTPLMLSGLVEECVNTIKYGGYIDRQRRYIDEQAGLDQLVIPCDFDYGALRALSYESREKLSRMRPATVGQAGRIDGVRAGDLAILTVMVRRLMADAGIREHRPPGKGRRP